MPLSHDTILLETVRTRRVRLHSALLHGGLAERRRVNDNLRRLVGGFLAAAVACVGCIGFALVTSLIAARDAGPRGPVPAATSPAVPGPTGGSRP